MFLYEEQRKSSAVAVLLSILIPGVGNIYADHVVGAIITWALIVGGVAVVGNSVHNTTDGYSYPNTTNVNSSELTLGIFMILGGFVYSPIDAYFASRLQPRVGAAVGLADGIRARPGADPHRPERRLGARPQLPLLKRGCVSGPSPYQNWLRGRRFSS